MKTTSDLLIYLLPAALLLISLVLCGFSCFFFKKEKLATYITLKGGSIAAITILCLTVENLLGIKAISGTTTFILIALVLQLFSAISAALPSKTNLFESLYSGLDMGSGLMLALAGLFLITPSPFGLPIGFGVGAITSVIVALALRKFNWKTDIFKYLSLTFGVALLGQVIVILLSTISVQTILFAVAAVLYFVAVIFKLFLNEEVKGIAIAKNIIYYLSLILFVFSIYSVVF